MYVNINVHQASIQKVSISLKSDLINRLKLSFSKDSNQSILEYLSSIMNEPKRS